MLFPMSFSPSSLESERKKRMYFCHSPSTHTPEWVEIFARNMNHAEKTSIETFWETTLKFKIRNMCL